MTSQVSYRSLQTIIVEACQRLPDHRSGQNTRYEISDAALGAFGAFFMQSPSFLAYQRDLQQRKECNNAQSLFGVSEIPSNQQIRNLLDPISPSHLGEPFWAILDQSMKDREIEKAFEYDGGWLCSIDGTQYFGSRSIHCAQCTVAHHEDGESYAHTVLITILAKPGKREVLVLEPEFIRPQDGSVKQDCEQKAAQRWIKRNATHFVGRSVTILADDLHCKQPFCQLLLDHQLDFILTCKEKSHSTLYEEVALLEQCGGVSSYQKRVWTGKGHQLWHYRFAERLPMRAPPYALYVNWCELTITREDTGKQVHHSAFVTNRTVSEHTVEHIIEAGRARWKVENEGNNVLKNHGYYLEHNYGHGHHHLAAILVMLILLAFLCHTVLHLCDHNYQRLRAELGARRTFFNDIRALTRYFYFGSWEHLIAFMINGLELAPG